MIGITVLLLATDESTCKQKIVRSLTKRIPDVSARQR